MYVYSKEQVKEIRAMERAEQQKQLAQSGIGSAIVNNKIITVGDYECNYYDWKHFVIGQIFRMGICQYIAKTGWDIYELKEDLAEVEQDDDLWWEDAEKYFNGMKGEF